MLSALNVMKQSIPIRRFICAFGLGAFLVAVAYSAWVAADTNPEDVHGFESGWPGFGLGFLFGAIVALLSAAGYGLLLGFGRSLVPVCCQRPSSSCPLSSEWCRKSPVTVRLLPSGFAWWNGLQHLLPLASDVGSCSLRLE